MTSLIPHLITDPFQFEGNTVDPNSMNQTGHSIVHSAVRSGNVNVVEMLLEKGVDEQRRTWTNLSAH